MVSSEIDPAKIAAFEATDYRVISDIHAMTLRIGDYAPKLPALFREAGVNYGVVITAFNPFAEQSDLSTNLAAQMQLEKELRALVPMVLQAEGADPTGAWPPEPSFFALGIGHSSAHSLGIKYRQDAVVWVGPDAIPQLVILR